MHTVAGIRVAFCLKAEYSIMSTHILLVCSSIDGCSGCLQVSISVQTLSRVRLFATPWTAARQASLSITNYQSSLRLTSIESVMPSTPARAASRPGLCAIAPGRRAGAPPVWKLTRPFPVQACKHPPAASLSSPAFRALGSKPGTKVLPGAH